MCLEIYSHLQLLDHNLYLVKNVSDARIINIQLRSYGSVRMYTFI